MPLLQPWLTQVQGADQHSLSNLGLAEFGGIIHATWTYSGTEGNVCVDAPTHPGSGPAATQVPEDEPRMHLQADLRSSQELQAGTS